VDDQETKVRPARPDELSVILDLWVRARSLPPSVPDDDGALAKLLARDPEGLLVAEHEGAIVGALIAAWDGWRGNMYRLAVVPDRRRRGVALELVRFGEQRLRARGARRISALVAEADETAASLWRAAGYSLDENVGRFVRNL
jgi:ribosomal protein S18 acetylase RimI-like enzyme